MDKNKKIIIVILLVILAILIVFIGYGLINNSNVEYRSIYLSNATTIEVPVSDKAQFVADDLGIKYYQDPKYDVSIVSWNSQEELSLKGAVDIAAQFEKQKGGNTPTIENGVPIYYNKETDMYCIETGNDTTHDNILIMCKNKDIALAMYSSIKYGVSSIDKMDGLSSSISTPTPINKTVNKNHDSDNDDSFIEDYDYDDSYYEDVETTADYSSSSSSYSSSSENAGVAEGSMEDFN